MTLKEQRQIQNQIDHEVVKNQNESILILDRDHHILALTAHHIQCPLDQDHRHDHGQKRNENQNEKDVNDQARILRMIHIQNHVKNVVVVGVNVVAHVRIHRVHAHVAAIGHIRAVYRQQIIITITVKMAPLAMAHRMVMVVDEAVDRTLDIIMVEVAVVIVVQ